MNQTNTELTAEHKRTILSMIQKLYNRKDAIDFRFPVDYEAFGKTDQVLWIIRKSSKK